MQNEVFTMTEKMRKFQFIKRISMLVFSHCQTNPSLRILFSAGEKHFPMSKTEKQLYGGRFDA